MVKSKYSFYTYLGIFSGISAISILIIFSITADVWENAKKMLIPKIVGIYIIIPLIIYMLYRVFKTSPQLEISQNRLKISGLLHKEEEFAINDILEIDLFTIGRYNGTATIITKIELANGKTIKLAVPNYKNISEVKLALVEYFPEKIKKTNPVPKKSAENSTINFESIKFSGNPYTSINGLLIYAFAIGIIISTLTSAKEFEPAHLFLIIPIAGLLLGLSYQLNYFIFSKGKLIVRNHFLPWIDKQYDIKNIISLNFENGRKSSYSLRITTKDYKSNNYPAGSLRDKTWYELKEYIKKLGIHFID